MLVGRLARASLMFLLAAAAVAAAPSAAMHTRLKKSSPAPNDSILAPTQLKFWFSEPVELAFTRITLTSTAGVKIPLEKLSFSDTTGTAAVVAPIVGTLPQATYTVTWSAAAKDGHPAKGEFQFVVKALRH